MLAHDSEMRASLARVRAALSATPGEAAAALRRDGTVLAAGEDLPSRTLPPPPRLAALAAAPARVGDATRRASRTIEGANERRRSSAVHDDAREPEPEPIAFAAPRAREAAGKAKAEARRVRSQLSRRGDAARARRAGSPSGASAPRDDAQCDDA
jgi:hypothetical protein